MRICLYIWAVVLFVAASPAFAGDYEDALAAHDAGKYEEALELLKPLGEAGNVDAQNKLSHMYWYGEGTAVDYDEALRWSRRAAATGSASAYYDIGVHYRAGLGVPQSDELAFEWQLKAANLGDSWAAKSVAVSYALGRGVSPDPILYLHWLRVAADLGSPDAELLIGIMSLSLGDIAEADRMLQASAASSEPEAALKLGRLFLEGTDGWSKDPTQALMWLTIAGRAGCLEAPALLKRAAAEADPRTLQDLDALVASWEAANPFKPGRFHPPEPLTCMPMAGEDA